jgi:hypothetical protein
MKVWLLGSIGILLLCGCAEVKYVKAGATESDFDAAKVACHNQILMSSSGVALTSSAMGKPGVRQGDENQSANQQARRDVDQCLQSKGWVKETEAK